MAVRIRLKKMGRRHRPFFRVCAMDGRAPRDGKVIEELGHYDPMVPETDARAILKGERIDYWLSVGAQPTPKVGVLIKKYGTGGTHLESQQAALDRLNQARAVRPVPVAVPQPKPQEEPQEEPTEASVESPAADEPVQKAGADAAETPTEEVAAEAQTEEVAAEATDESSKGEDTPAEKAKE